MGKKRRNRIILGIGLGIVVAVIVAGYLPKGYFLSGFGGTHNHKTLWDWLSLAGVPLSVAGLGYWLQLQQQKQNDLQKQRELEQTEKLAAVERDIAEQNRQEEALQNYYDKVSALLVDKNLIVIAAKVPKVEFRDQEAEESPTDSDTGDTATPEEKELLGVSMDIIRARTLTTLRRLDGSRKASLIRFLAEAEIIKKKVGLSIEGADLTSAMLACADLRDVNLSDTNLTGADLKKANLELAELNRTIFTDADLADAQFYKAHLESANLTNANLSGARFWGADLAYADFSGANLSGTYLSHTDLRAAKGLTKEQLEGKEPPYLCHTKLPEGIDINSDRDCGSYDDIPF